MPRPIAVINSANPDLRARSFRPAVVRSLFCVARALRFGRLCPLRFDPFPSVHALSARIQGPLRTQHVTRQVLDMRGEAVAVPGLKGQRFEDELSSVPGSSVALGGWAS